MRKTVCWEISQEEADEFLRTRPHLCDARRRVSLGLIIVPHSVQDRIEDSMVTQILLRHGHGDWGDARPDSCASNEKALLEGGELFSVYRLECGPTLWVSTEQDRSRTTMMFPY